MPMMTITAFTVAKSVLRKWAIATPFPKPKPLSNPSGPLGSMISNVNVLAVSSSPSSCGLYARDFSTTRDKLGQVMDEYRMKNFSQTIPGRFAKEICKAADKDNDGHISALEVKNLLKNIGVEDALTPEEISSVMVEVFGEENVDESKGVPVDKLIEYLKQAVKERKK